MISSSHGRHGLFEKVKLLVEPLLQLLDEVTMLAQGGALAAGVVAGEPCSLKRSTGPVYMAKSL